MTPAIEITIRIIKESSFNHLSIMQSDNKTIKQNKAIGTINLQMNLLFIHLPLCPSSIAFILSLLQFYKTDININSLTNILSLNLLQSTGRMLISLHFSLAYRPILLVQLHDRVSSMAMHCSVVLQ